MLHPSFPTPLALAAALALQVGTSAAQTAPADGIGVPVETVVIRASADASAAGLSKAYAGGQVARGGRVGLLGNQDMMDTPFASTNFTQALLQDQQTRSVADVLLNDPAVRNARGFGNFQELYVIRGFPIYSDDMAYNGLYGLLPRQYVAAELLERVEVFRGASGFLNGAAPGGSGLGGAINLLPKRATDAPQTQVTFGVESGGQAMLGLDLSRRFGPDKATGVRVNVVRRQGDTAVDDEHRELSLFAVGLDWHNRSVRLSADIGYQDHQQDAPRPSVTPLGAIPDAPDADSNFAQPWTYANERQVFGTLRGEFDLSPDTLMWVAAGLRSGTEANRLANPSAAADGATSAYRFDNKREDSVYTGEVGLRTSLQTGPVIHDLSLAAAQLHSDAKNAYAFSNFAGFTSSLYQPVTSPIPAADFFVGGKLDDPLTTAKTTTSSIALADTLRFANDLVRVTLGARHQTIEDSSYNYTTGDEESHYKASRVTPMLGIVVKPSQSLSVYANYIEGLVKGDKAPLTASVAGPDGTPITVTPTNANQTFKPYKTKQAELGLKFDTGRLGGSVSVFNIEKPVGALIDNGDQTATYVVEDAQRHRGLELSVFGEATRGLKLLGGLSLIDAEMTKTGKQAIGVPRHQLNLGAEWTPAALPDLALNARVVNTGRQWADAANTASLDAWTRLDIGARYNTEIGQTPLTLRARIDNVFNKSFWASAGGYPGSNYLVLGSPRTFVLSATVDF